MAILALFAFVLVARVKGPLVRGLLGDKVLIFKKKKRKGYRKTQGHRQNLAEVRIDAIEA